MMQKGVRRPGNQQLMSKSLVPWVTQDKELGRKVAWDLLAWQKGISSPRENNKRESSQKVGLKKVESRSLGEGKNKSQPSRTPQNGKVSKSLFEEGISKEENNKE